MRQRELISQPSSPQVAALARAESDLKAGIQELHLVSYMGGRDTST